MTAVGAALIRTIASGIVVSPEGSSTFDPVELVGLTPPTLTEYSTVRRSVQLPAGVVLSTSRADVQPGAFFDFCCVPPAPVQVAAQGSTGAEVLGTIFGATKPGVTSTTFHMQFSTWWDGPVRGATMLSTPHKQA